MTNSLFPDPDPPELDIDTAPFPDEPGQPTAAEPELTRCGFCEARGCRHLRCRVVLESR